MSTESDNKPILQGRVEVTEHPRNDNLENFPDVDSARQSSNEDRQKALDVNPDKHSGSAGGKSQAVSIEFVIRDHQGKEAVAFSRKIGGTEKDVNKLEERKQSIHIDELKKLAPTDIVAEGLLRRMEQAKTTHERQAVQREADQLYGRGEFAVHKHSEKQIPSAAPNGDKGKTIEKRDKVNTKILRSIETDPTISPDKRQLARDLQHMRTEAKQTNNSTEVIDSYAQEQLTQEIKSRQLPAETETVVDGDQSTELSVSGMVFPRAEKADTPITPETGKDAEALTNSPEGWIAVGRKIAELPLDKQVQVIGAGLLAGLEKVADDERQRTFGSLVGTVEGVGNVAQNLAKIADFGAALILNDKENAGKLGEEFGNSVGQTIVSGVQLFRAADAYFYDVGFTGDYAKPFRDVVRAGAVMNDEWSKKTPFEQERIKSKFVAELVADGAVGGAAAGAIKKAGKFTEMLDIVADEAKVWHAAGEPTAKKAAHAINNAISDVFEPAAETNIGMKMNVPKEKVSLEDYYAKMQKKASSYEGDDIWRGDDSPYSSINQKGRRKAHVNMEGDLCAADPKGMYKGQEVTVGHHIDGDWNRAIKSHSPYISFSADDGVAKWGGKTITLNYKELRRAIAAGEVKDVEILDLPQILRKIDECPLSEIAKVKLRARAIRHNEILIRGKVPQRFFTVSEPPPEI